MKHLEVYIELERENKIRQRQIEINNRARKFRELETPRYREVMEEMKIENYNEWVRLMNQIDIIIDERIKHMIVFSL